MEEKCMWKRKGSGKTRRKTRFSQLTQIPCDCWRGRDSENRRRSYSFLVAFMEAANPQRGMATRWVQADETPGNLTMVPCGPKRAWKQLSAPRAEKAGG